MASLRVISGHNSQTKLWSFPYWLDQSREGFILLRNEIITSIKEVWREFIWRKTEKREPLDHRKTLRQSFREGLPPVYRENEQDLEEQSWYTSQTRLVSTSKSSLSVSNLSSPPTNSRLPQASTTVHLPVDDLDSQSTSLKYGVILMSKMGNLIGLWIPSFSLDIKHGLQPSRLFVLLNYCLLVFFFAIGMVLVKIVLEPSLIHVLPKIAKSLIRVFEFTVFVSEISYLLYGFFTCGYVQYQRHFLQDFFLYQSSMITLPRYYQRRLVVHLFLLLYIFAFLNEPLYALLSLNYDIQQPKLWNHLSSFTFMLAKIGIMTVTAVGASLVSSCSLMIPLMTCFLVSASAKHLENTLAKQSVRYHRVDSGSPVASESGTDQASTKLGVKRNLCLERLLDKRTRKLIKDYSCDTIAHDWPDLFSPATEIGQPSPGHISGEPINCRLDFSFTNSSLGLPCPASAPGQPVAEVNNLAEGQIHHLQHMGTGSTGGLLFLYKNLIKNMSELKQMIRSFETKFSSFHQINTNINCLIVAQWITVAFTEARGTSVARSMRVEADGGILPEGQQDNALISPYVSRIIGGVLTFIVSNIYIIMWCDCLSRRMNKTKCQLFMMNIESTRSFITLEHQQRQQLMLRDHHNWNQVNGSQHQQQQVKCLTQSVPGLAELVMWPRPNSQKRDRRIHSMSGVSDLPQVSADQKRLETPKKLANYLSEIDQIWCLYDQVERLSSATLFRFSSTTYYTKRCLLTIFGRALSVLLLFIQIIDMYTYS